MPSAAQDLSRSCSSPDTWTTKYCCYTWLNRSSYVAVAVLCFRQNKLGYGIGLAISAEWNAYDLFSSGFIAAGFRQLSLLLREGRISNPVHLMGALAGIDHFALMACLVWGYAKLPSKRFRDVFILLGSAVLVTAYFLAIRVAMAAVHSAIEGELPSLIARAPLSGAVPHREPSHKFE